MSAYQSNLGELTGEIQAIANAIHARCAIIADELDRSARMNGDRIAGAQAAIAAEIHRFHRFAPSFTAGYEAAVDAQDGQRIAPPHWLEANTRMGRLRIAINDWHGIRDLIARQCPPRRVKLDATPERAGPALVASTRAGDILFERLLGILNPNEQSAEAEAHGCFRDIGLAHSTFMNHALAAWRILLAQGKTSDVRFIDIGCGGGLKVLSALEFFDAAAGLEYDPAYVGAAQKLLARAGRPDVEILHGDALEFDRYDQYDVVYFHRPMSDDAALRRLEQRIAAHVRPDTLLIAPYTQFTPHAAGVGCFPVAERVYLPHSTARKAAALRRKAEYMGTNVRPRPRPLSSVWDPILDASRRRGF